MSKIYRYIVAGAITALVLFLVWYFSNVVAYILVAAVLATIGKPLTDLLCRLRLGRTHIAFPRWAAALCTLIAIWAAAIGVVALIVPIIFHKINEFSALDIPQLIDSFREPLNSFELFIRHTFAIEDSDFSIVNAISNQLRPLLDLNYINTMLTSIVSTVTSSVIAAFSITFITFFFLKESDLFFNMIIIMFPKKYEANITHALTAATQLLTRYFTGIVAESIMMTILVSLGLLIWGLPSQDVLVIGLIVGVLNVIPYVGPAIGIILGIFIGLTGMGNGATSVHLALEIAGTILCAQGIDNFVLQPLLYSNRVKAHPLEIFLVILIAGSIAGVWGMLLAIPAYTVIRVFAKEFFNNFRVVQKLTEKI